MFQVFLAIPLSLNLLFTPPSAKAISATPPASDAIRQEVTSKIREHRATVEAKISLIRQERIRLFWGRMTTRIQAFIDRLNKLIDRMESRIQKIKDANEDIDTSSAEADIAKAKDLLAQAQTDLDDAKASLEDVLASQTPKEAFKTVIDDVHNIKNNLTEVHRLLVHAISEIKGLRVGEGS